jgi:putative nucleotidyltransferase with HDIG domain
MPATTMIVLNLLRDPKVGADRVEEAIKHDPGLVVNVLKLANSAYFGYPKAIASVRAAIVRLGWKRVYQLVVASCVNGMLSEPVQGYDLGSGELWRHSVAVAVATEHLCRQMGIEATDEAFTGALLHDVGKMVIGRFADADFGRLEKLTCDGMSFEAAEREVLGTDHAEVGAMILEKWAFPNELVEVVRWHHDPDGGGGASPVVDMVHIADVLSLSLGIGAGREGVLYEPAEPVVARLQLKDDDIETVAGKIVEDVDEICSALSEPVNP